jgi:hypothetical protein
MITPEITGQDALGSRLGALPDAIEAALMQMLAARHRRSARRLRAARSVVLPHRRHKRLRGSAPFPAAARLTREFAAPTPEIVAAIEETVRQVLFQ